MSFKLKKKIHEILDMNFETYAKFLKKEIRRAAKFGELDAVFCHNHTFADGKESTLVLMGVFTGQLADFFKKNKANPYFAKGKCFFETTDEGIKMHIALNAGKSKPDKIAKAGRKLWSKVALVHQFHDGGKLPFLDEALDEVNVGETELLKTADKENEDQSIKVVKNNYLKAKKALQDRVVPLISNKQTLDSAYTNQHFQIAKIALKSALSFIDKFKEVDKQTQATYEKEMLTINKESLKIKRIAAKIKQALMASNTVDIELNKKASREEQKETIQGSLNALDNEFNKLQFLSKEVKKALKYLDTILN